MKIKISSFYEKQGYVTAYLTTNKENRKIITLRKLDGEMHSMSYAKYLYTSHYEMNISDKDHIDHINNDKTDDRIDNLQLISARQNITKSHRRKEMVVLICPVCKKEFIFQKRNLSTHPNPCCSRKCGGIKSHWK